MRSELRAASLANRTTSIVSEPLQPRIVVHSDEDVMDGPGRSTIPEPIAPPRPVSQREQSASPFTLRGAVEGFYGVFYTPPERNDLIRFLGKNGFNLYVYGPKNDRQHRAR